MLKKDPSGHDDTGRTGVGGRNYWINRDQGNHSGIKKKKLQETPEGETLNIGAVWIEGGKNEKERERSYLIPWS